MILHEKGKQKAIERKWVGLTLMDNLIKMPVTEFIDAVDVCQYLCKEEY